MELPATPAEYFHLTRLSRSTACPGGNVTVLRRVLGLGFREACPGGHRPEKESTKAAGAPVPESLTQQQLGTQPNLSRFSVMKYVALSCTGPDPPDQTEGRLFFRTRGRETQR